MKTITVEHNHPVFSKLVPSSNKREIIIREGVTVYASQEKSGGSWTGHYRAKLDNPAVSLPVSSGTGFPSFQPGENEVLPGEYFLETGYFQGKPSKCRIILHPDDYARMCTPRCTLHEECALHEDVGRACAASGLPALSERMGKILGCYKMTGGYRKESLTRMKVQPEEIESLVSSGLLVKKGSGIGLTAAGRNHAKDNY